MMNVPSNDPIIVCPKCSAQIRLTESLAAPILAATKREYQKKLAHQEKVLQDREQSLLTEEAEISKKSDGLGAEIQKRLRAERENIVKEEAQRVRLALRDQMQESQEEVAELKKVITERDKKLEEAGKVQTEIKRKERALEDVRREIELTVESRVNDSLVELRSNALKEAEGKLKFKITEKEETIASMQQQIEILKQNRDLNRFRVKLRRLNWKAYCAPDSLETLLKQYPRASAAAMFCSAFWGRTARVAEASSGSLSAPRNGVIIG